MLGGLRARPNEIKARSSRPCLKELLIMIVQCALLKCYTILGYSTETILLTLSDTHYFIARRQIRCPLKKDAMHEWVKYDYLKKMWMNVHEIELYSPLDEKQPTVNLALIRIRIQDQFSTVPTLTEAGF